MKYTCSVRCYLGNIIFYNVIIIYLTTVLYWHGLVVAENLPTLSSIANLSLNISLSREIICKTQFLPF